VVALGSIGLASVAALLAPAGPSAEQVVATTAGRAVAGRPNLTPGGGARADAQDGASLPAIRRR
jgi:hypothetical protein